MSFTRVPQKTKLSTLAAPPIGQNAKNLDELLQAIKDEYVYNTRNLLRTARKASMRAAKRQLDACGHQPPLTRATEPETGQFVRCVIDVYDAAGNVVNRKSVSRQATILPKVEGVPRYKDFNTIRKNHHVKDEEVLRYVPYFGETDDVDLTDAYKVEVRSVGEEEDLELCKILSRIVERYLEINNVTVEQVQKVLNESPGKSKPDALTLKIERLKEQWDEKTEIVLEAVLESLTNNTKTPLENQVSPVRGVKNVQEDPTETYRLLSCSICTTHDCCFHDLDRCEVLPNAPDESTPFPENEPCSEECYLHQRDSDGPLSDPGIWTEEEISLLEACVRIQGKIDRISCLAAIGLGRPCDKVHSKLSSKNLLPKPPTTTATTTTTVTTTTSTTVTITAAAAMSEQSRPSSSSRQSRSMSIESSTTAQNKSQPQPVHVHKKRKTTYSSKSSKAASRTEYPADCNLSADNEKRSKFTPCDHEGPCGRGCPCVDDQVHCEKACACPPDCPRRWRGCSCKKGGACGSWSCECYKWSRECDVDLCGSCHAAEILDPVNLAKERNGEIYEGGCANVSIQRGETKRTLMGRSAIAGWGLFAGERVKAGQFLGEYKGEIIGNEESERRGLLYDKKGVSFLFTLNKDQVVDATRAANKFRFVNHSRKDPNCFAKISFVNGVHRIGMYAKTDLYPGQELFFDYGYNSKSTKFVPLEHQARSKDSKVRVKLAGRNTKGTTTTKEAKQGVHSVQRVKRIEDDDEDSEEDSDSFQESDESD